jgi:2,4-dienoyl-CoA reductase-like NADH-dependent reductase (Old Yellow Enzyme family)
MDRVTAIPEPPPGVRYLSSDEIEEIKDQFVAATVLAERAGFDGVDIKLCHGYLGNELVRPVNTRPDRWGGSFEDRTRFVREVYAGIVSAHLGHDFVVGSRISFHERRPGGCGTAGPDSTAFDPRESLELIGLLSRLGAAYVNVSGGGLGEDAGTDACDDERRVGTLYYERLARSYVLRQGLDLAIVGSGYSELGPQALSVARERVSSGQADLVGFGRQSFADPEFPLKLRDGRDVQYCRQCGSCATLMLAQRDAGCVARDPYYREQLRELRRGRDA